MRSVSSSISATRLLATLAGLCLTMTVAAAAQPRTYHPKITSLSTSTPTPGQAVTISGTDLLPPTWTAKLQYHDRYGSGFHELELNGSNSALTFAAPSNVRPDSIAIQYSNASTTDALSNPIPQLEQRAAGPFINVQQRPRMDTTGFTTATGGGGQFRTIATGSHTITGQFLLGPTTASVVTSGGLTGGVISQPTLNTTVIFSSAPTTTFLGSPLSVSSATYIRNSRDEVVIAMPATLAHNTTGFIKMATPAGADSTRVTFVRPPQSAVVLEILGASTPVTNGQLVRGRQYIIRGLNLVVHQQTSSNSFNVSTPTVSLGGVALNLLNTVFVSGATNDTLVGFSVPAGSSLTGGPLVLSHAGGNIALGNFTVISPPAPLQISGAVVSPNDIIAGTSATITLSLNPSPTNFSTAGELSIGIPASLSGAIAPIASVAITSNPMTITVPTRVIQTTATGNITVAHNTQNGGSASLAVTVRPPRPTAVVVASDTIAGSTTATGTVSFDLPGAATVLLSSSDPSVVSVPASVARSGTSATFPITTTAVTTPHSIAISASLNGVSVSKTVVIRSGRLTSFVASPTAINAGESVGLTMTFDAPVTNLPVTLASSDTALKAVSTLATGTSKQISASSTKSLLGPVSATLTATDGAATKSVVVQINPIQISTFTVSPASGPGGATLAATVRLTRTALQQQLLELTSSDTTVAKVPSALATFNVGEDVKIVTILMRGPQTSSRTATITAKVHTATNTSSTSVINSKTVSVTATP